MSTRFIYNADRSISVVPDFNNKKRWKRERELNEKYFEIERRQEFLISSVEPELLKSEGERLPNHQAIIDQIAEEIKVLERKKYQIEQLKTTNYKRNNASDKGYKMTAKAKRKIRGLCQLQFDQQRKHGQWMEFITLTTTVKKDGSAYNPEKDDKVVSKVFKRYIDSLRKTYGLKHYIYVVERQKRGDIHYHCVFIWKNKSPKVFNLNLYWLKLLSEQGWSIMPKHHKRKFCKRVDLAIYRQDMKVLTNIPPMQVSPTAFYNDKNGKRVKISKMVFNPVDREEIRSSGKLAYYLTKYMTKGTEKIYTRVWGASKALLGVPVSIDLHDGKATKEVREFVQEVDGVVIEESEFSELIYNRDLIVEKSFEKTELINGELYTFSKWQLNSSADKIPIIRKAQKTLLQVFQRVTQSTDY